MSYITQTDIANRVTNAELVLITTDNPAASVANATKIDDAIEDAEGVVDSYVGKRYMVPMMDVPKAVIRHATSLAIFYLYRDRSTARDDESVKDNYDEAMAFLKDVNIGKAVLHGVTSQAELSGPDTNSFGFFKANDRVFTRDNLSGF